MDVKILRNTAFEGEKLKTGDTFPADEKTAERWIKNGIAELIEIEQDPPKEDPPKEDPPKTEPVKTKTPANTKADPPKT